MEVNIPNCIMFYYTGDNLELNISNFRNINKNFNVILITNEDFILDLAKIDF